MGRAGTRTDKGRPLISASNGSVSLRGKNSLVAAQSSGPESGRKRPSNMDPLFWQIRTSSKSLRVKSRIRAARGLYQQKMHDVECMGNATDPKKCDLSSQRSFNGKASEYRET
jgi:hypothetical protein